MTVAQTTFFAKTSGFEIGPHVRQSSGRLAEGRIVLRFFRLKEGGTALRFVLEPAEGYDIFCRIRQIAREGGRSMLLHRFEGDGGEVITRLTLESYDKGERTGFAFSLRRGEEEINVPVSAERFLFAGEFLRHLALTQSWVEVPPRKGQALGGVSPE